MTTMSTLEQWRRYNRGLAAMRRLVVLAPPLVTLADDAAAVACYAAQIVEMIARAEMDLRPVRPETIAVWAREGAWPEAVCDWAEACAKANDCWAPSRFVCDRDDERM